MSVAGFKVYFGGTFDPPHLGHHEIVKALLLDAWVETLYLVPTSQNPLKENVSSQDRGSWVEAWLEQLKKELTFSDYQKLKLVEDEMQAEGRSYTVETLRALQAREALGPWVLAMGADSLASLDRWKNVQELLGALHSVWVFPRGTWTARLEVNEELKSLASFRVMTAVIPEISSTEIRHVLAGPDALQKLDALPVPATVLKRLKEKF